MKNEGMHEIKGKGWYFSTNIIGNDGLVHRVYGQWYPTKNECRAAMVQKKAEIIEESESAKSKKSFDDVWEEFRSYSFQIVSSSTITSNYDYVYPKYLKEHFLGSSIVESLEVGKVISWYSWLTNLDESKARKNCAVVLYKKIIKFAYDNCYIDPKVFQLADVKVVKFRIENDQPKKEKVAWTEEEIEKFFASMKKGSVDWIMFTFFLSTGMRIGEFQAIRPMDLDFDKKEVIIRRQFRKEGKNGLRLVDTLKTKGSRRTIPMSDDLCKLMKTYISDFGIHDDWYLFGAHKETKPESRNAFVEKLKKYIRLSGIRYNCPHGARHTLSTELVGKCKTIAEVQAVSKSMGHSVNTDLEIYSSHNNDSLAREIFTSKNKA